MLRIFISFIVISLFSLQVAFSSEGDSIKYPNFELDGTLKNKYEYVPSIGTSRFSVRNSRLGVSGKIFPMVNYRAQVELSSEGRFQVLDLSGIISPYKGLSFTLGQTSVPIFNSYTISPGPMLFANRTFLAKYYTGTRDIGLVTKYVTNTKVPLTAEFGLFNGNGINNPAWQTNLSYAARLSLGSMKGFRSTAKVYNLAPSSDIHYLIYGADLRYEGDNWKVETEFMKKDDKVNNINLSSAYIQGAYSISLKDTYLFKNIMPAFRYDYIDQTNNKSYDVSRLTWGLGFGLDKKPFGSLLRIDYEWYFINNQLSILHQYDEMDANKLTVELVYIF